MDGIEFQGRMLYGIRELHAEQTAHQLAIGRAVLAERGPGLVVGRLLDGRLDSQWRVDADPSTSGVRVRTRPGVAPMVPSPAHPDRWPGRADARGGAVGVDDQGIPFELDGQRDDPALAVPDDGVWRSVLVRPVRVPEAEGTIELTAGSTTITGQGTRFTRLVEPAAGVAGSLIIVDDGPFAGVYRVDEIVGDTELTVAVAPAGTGSDTVRWRPGGEFTAAPVERPTWGRRAVEVALVGKVVARPSGWFLLADVRRTGGSTACQVVDRRRGNLSRPLTAHTFVRPLVRVEANNEVLVAWRRTVGNIDTPRNCSLAPRRDGGWIAVWDDPTLTLAQVARFDAEAETWAVETLYADGREACVVEVPAQRTASGFGLSHLLFEIESNEVRVRPSADDADSFGTATVILPAITSISVSRPVACVTAWGRVILAYRREEASIVTVHYIYSDDYGATWETNSGEGFLLATTAGGLDVQHPVAMFLWPDGRISTLVRGSTGIDNQWLILSADTSSPTPADPSSADEHLLVGSGAPPAIFPVGDHVWTLQINLGAGSGMIGRPIGVYGAPGAEQAQYGPRGVVLGDLTGTAPLVARVCPRTGAVLVLYVADALPPLLRSAWLDPAVVPLSIR